MVRLQDLLRSDFHKRFMVSIKRNYQYKSFCLANIDPEQICPMMSVHPWVLGHFLKTKRLRHKARMSETASRSGLLHEDEPDWL